MTAKDEKFLLLTRRAYERLGYGEGKAEAMRELSQALKAPDMLAAFAALAKKWGADAQAAVVDGRVAEQRLRELLKP